MFDLTPVREVEVWPEFALVGNDIHSRVLEDVLLVQRDGVRDCTVRARCERAGRVNVEIERVPRVGTTRFGHACCRLLDGHSFDANDCHVTVNRDVVLAVDLESGTLVLSNRGVYDVISVVEALREINFAVTVQGRVVFQHPERRVRIGLVDIRDEIDRSAVIRWNPLPAFAGDVRRQEGNVVLIVEVVRSRSIAIK